MYFENKIPKKNRSDAEFLKITIQGTHIYSSVWVMESTDQHTVQLTHETRYDAKGRSPAWYDKTCPYQLACDLTRIRDTFLLDD